MDSKQLAEAQGTLSDAAKTSNDHVEATRKRAEAFKEEQVDIDRRLKAITKSDASDEAAQRLEASMNKLRRLEIARGYVALLKESDELRYLRFPISVGVYERERWMGWLTRMQQRISEEYLFYAATGVGTVCPIKEDCPFVERCAACR